MTHRNRIRADRWIGSPLAFLCNGVARILGAVLRRDHSSDPATVRTIVVAKLVGMGSCVQATPLLRALKGHYPRARLVFLTLESNRELVRRLPAIDEVVCLDDRGMIRMAATTLRAIAGIARRRADLYFDLEVYSAFASLLALWALTRNRIGFYRHSTRFKRGIFTHLVYYNTRVNVRALYVQLGRVLGVPPLADLSVGPIRVEEQDREGLRAKLPPAAVPQPGTPLVVVNPNASDLLVERRWPAEHVCAAVEALVGRGARVALIGSAQERPYVETIVARLPAATRERVSNTAGSLRLGEVLALLEIADCVVTNDTGPMHWSAGLRRPTVCLFGPVSPDHHRHDLPEVTTLWAPVICSPCVHEIDRPPCGGDNVCMQRLAPELVVEAVTRRLAAPARGAADELRLPLAADGPGGEPLGFVVRDSVRRSYA